MSDFNKPKTLHEVVKSNSLKAKMEKVEKINKAYSKIKTLNIPSNVLKTSLIKYSLECKKKLNKIMHRATVEPGEYTLNSKDSMIMLELVARTWNIQYIDKCIEDFENRLDDIVIMLNENGYLDFSLPNKENYPNDVFFNLFLSLNTNNSSIELSVMRDENGKALLDNVVSLTYDPSSKNFDVWKPFNSDLFFYSKMYFSNLKKKTLDDEVTLQETIDQINAIQSTNFRQCLDFFLMKFAKKYSNFCLRHNQKRYYLTNVELDFNLDELSKLFRWKVSRNTRGENKIRILEILDNITSLGATIVKFKNKEAKQKFVETQGDAENLSSLFEVNKQEYFIDESFNCQKELKYNSSITLFPKYRDNQDGTITISMDNDFANYLCTAYFVKYPLELNYLPNNRIGCNAFLIGKAIAMYLSNALNTNKNIISIETLLAYSSVPTVGRLKEFSRANQTNRYIKKPLLEALELLATTCYLDYKFVQRTTKDKKETYQELDLEQVKKMRIEKITKLSLKCKFNSWEHYETLESK